jgi:hypothetical protein
MCRLYPFVTDNILSLALDADGKTYYDSTHPYHIHELRRLRLSKNTSQKAKPAFSIYEPNNKQPQNDATYIADNCSQSPTPILTDANERIFLLLYSTVFYTT